MKTLLTVLVTAIVMMLVFSTPGTSTTNSVKLRIGQDLIVPGLDLWCSSWRRDPDGNERGALMYCHRYSDERSRAINISKWHFGVSNRNGDWIIYRVNRSP